MTGIECLPHIEQLRRLSRLAEAALGHYALPAGATPRLVNVSENATYRVDAGDRRYALQGPSRGLSCPAGDRLRARLGRSPCVPTGRQ